MTDKCTFSEMKMERNRNIPETDDKTEIYDAGYDEAIQNVCEDSYRRGWRDGYDEGRKIGHSECAAGPWQPMETAPRTEDETILIKDDGGSVYTAVYWKADKWCTWGSDGHHSVIQKSEIIAWARINLKEDADA